jgi:hypothetical protein
MAILLGPSAVCGCGGNQVLDQLKCCQVLDLGMIYEEIPVYGPNDPCVPTRLDSFVGSPPICTSTPDPSPYGEVLDYTRACASLVIWTGAQVVGGSISGTRHTLFSRQRKDLPSFSGDNCINPIYCPAENETFECCGAIYPNSSPESIQVAQRGGPYLHCPLVQGEDDICRLECNGSFKPQIFKYGMSNCELEYEDPEDGIKKVILAGYAPKSNWWFVDDGAFETVTDAITSYNPHGSSKQTIYAHFQVEWKPIRCLSRGGIVGAGCEGLGRVNLREGRCGNSYTQGLVDDGERERAVKITASIGFSLGECGFDPQRACDETYN